MPDGPRDGSVAGLVELDRTSLRDRAVDRLRQALAGGELDAGAPLVLTDLSVRLGISRGTLREAVRQLEFEGLVEAGPRGRLVVRDAGAVDLERMFAVRGALEGLAAAMLAGRPDRAGAVTSLRVRLQGEAGAGADIPDLLVADLAFGRELCGLADATTLLRAWETLVGLITRAVARADPADARAALAPERRRRVLVAVAAGDPHRARQVAQEQVAQAAAALVRPSGVASAGGPSGKLSTVNG